jgi:dUTP pyrophosphatase
MFPDDPATECVDPQVRRRSQMPGVRRYLPRTSRLDGSISPLNIKKLDKQLPTPRRSYPGDAGVDLYTTEDVILARGQRKLVPTGIAIELPEGYVGLVVPRSGLAHKHGLSIVNSPGIIDSGYRGEIKVNLINTDGGYSLPLFITRGERIAQLLIQKVEIVEFTVVDALEPAARANRGHGSSGV